MRAAVVRLALMHLRETRNPLIAAKVLLILL